MGGSIGDSGGDGVLTIQVLARGRAVVHADCREIVLSERQSEILALLAAHPAGMTGEQLALALDGEQGKPKATRAQISRLNRLLGACIQTDPYRLHTNVQSDIGEVQQLLHQGRVHDAAARYHGPILPRSNAPGVIHLREELDDQTRRAAFAAQYADALWKWVNTTRGQNDIKAWKRLLTIIPHNDARRACATTRLDCLRPPSGVVAVR